MLKLVLRVVVVGSLTFLTSTVARGYEALELESILQRHFEAMGGLAHLESIKALRIRGEFTLWSNTLLQLALPPDGLAGSFTYAWAGPYQLQLSSAFNGITVTSCLDDMQSWTSYSYSDGETEGSTKVIVQRYDRAITDDYRASSEWWGPVIAAWREGSKIELLGTKKVLGSQRIALRLYRAGRTPQMVYLSQKSFLPVRIDSHGSINGKSFEIYEMPRLYRELAGVLLPTQVVYRTPQGEKLSTWNYQKAEVLPRLQACREVPAETPREAESVELLRGKLRGSKTWRRVAPVSETLKVAILPPAIAEDLEWVHASWATDPNTEYHNGWLVKVELARLFEEEFRRLICGLFPRCEAVDTLTGDKTYDLSFRGDLKVSATTLYSSPETSLERAHLNSSVFVGLANADAVEVATLSQTATPQGFSERTNLSRTRGMGSRALSDLLRQLAVDLPRSPRLRDVLVELELRYAKAPDLQLEVSFDEPGELTQNGSLDAGERAQLRLVLRNLGPGPAFATRVHIRSPGTQWTLPGGLSVQRLAPGEEWNKIVPFTVPLDLPEAEVEFHVSATEERGYAAQSVVLRVAAARLVRPTLEVADVVLNDRTLPAEGNGDGRPSNGETIEVVARVANRGPGIAVGALVTCVAHTGGVKVIKRRLELSPIAPHATQVASFLIRLPRDFGGDRLDLAITATEIRGKEVAQVEKTVSWPTVLRFAELIPELLVHDGDSPGSTGNRDGVASNGEKVELVVRLSNRGNLSAYNTRLTLKAEGPGVQVLVPTVELGELPAGRGPLEARFQVRLPRADRRLEKVDQLAFRLEVYQENRPMEEHRQTVAFQYRRPELVVEARMPDLVTAGVADKIELQLRNIGSMAAEEVVVELAATDEEKHVRLGGTSPVFQHAIGVLEPGASSLPISVGILIPGGIGLKGSLELSLLVRQRDFPEVRQPVSLSVGPVSEHIVRVEPRGERLATNEIPRPTLGATISFLTPLDGTETTASETSLRFEVQVPSALEDLRLTRNGKRVDLNGPVRLDSMRGGGRESVIQVYEVPLPLDEGNNFIEVTALTSEGYRSTRDIMILRRRHKGRIWVASIGVSDYQKPEVTDLHYAAIDASAVADYYRIEMGLAPEQVLTLLEEEATLENIKRMLGSEMYRLAHDPDDTVILYFAGHGLSEVDQASPDADHLSKYLLPYDGAVDDLFATALPMDDIWKIVRRLRANRVVFVIDACFSGAAGGRTVYDPDRISRVRLTDEFLRRIASGGEGRVILAASGANELAQEGKTLGHGTFTYYFLRGLRGAADGNGDGAISVDEVYSYASQQVRRETKNNQNPIKKAPLQTGEIVIGHSVPQP